LTGPDVVDAEVRFDNGLNVISGPSDTGKTFVLQCIDFMLGSQRLPGDIPEAAPYDTVLLGIRPNNSDTEMTLSRSLRGGAFTLSIDCQDEQILKEQHAADREDTLSHFLLDLARLSGKWIRKNMHGKTQSLSFRNLVHLCLVSEEDVIRTESPILTGQHVSGTAELSVFRLLLSGIDDSSVVAAEEPRISRTRVEAKVEVLQGLVDKTKRQIGELQGEADLPSLREQLQRVETTIEEASAELNIVQESVAAMEDQRRSTWTKLRQVESRLEVLAELDRRFKLLGEQYRSDLKRLEAIAETGRRLGEMKMERCPVCGALVEYHNEEHQEAQSNPEAVANACTAEAQKIRSLLADLQVTQDDVRSEIGELATEKRERRTKLEAVGNEIRERLQPHLQVALQQVLDCQEKRDGIRRAGDLLERLAELQDLIAEVSDAPTRTSSGVDIREIHTADIEAFCKEAEARLRAWNFPGLDRVTFSEKDRDIVISGRRRTSHGKGVRAVTHAAFNLALLRYCVDRELPYPGFVVIDSPLVVYREPDTDEEGFSRDVKDSFFKDLAASFVDAQVIILENEEPPIEVAEDRAVNLIKFTGTNVGRRGFIPATVDRSQ
jgi:peptidoglycan hydrolase CwlO-like protein